MRASVREILENEVVDSRQAASILGIERDAFRKRAKRKGVESVRKGWPLFDVEDIEKLKKRHE